MRKIILILVVLAICSCSDDAGSSSEGCVWADDINRTFDKDDEVPCIRNDVYSFKGELYAICYCCLCGKIEQVLSCDGKNICTGVDNCTSDFLDVAEYEYSFD